MSTPQALVAQFEAIAQMGRTLSAPVLQARKRLPKPLAGGKTCLILSPHPDDECINGALPLRLLREGGWRVVNVAVTQGSNPQRQIERAIELEAACQVLGFDNVQLAPRGLLRVSAPARLNDPVQWAHCVTQVRAQLERFQPDLIVCPHATDAQAAHIGTHWLALDALAAMPASYSPWVALSEYWSTMAQPNLMVQLAGADVVALLTALMQHKGEVARNPYHASLPAWMMDNVRRGAEQVGLPGGMAPNYTFAVLHRVMRWHSGGLRPAWAEGRFAPSDQAIDLTVLAQTPGLAA